MIKNLPGVFFSKAKQSPNAAALDAAEITWTSWQFGSHATPCRWWRELWMLTWRMGLPLSKRLLKEVTSQFELFITRLTQLRGLTITMVAYRPTLGPDPASTRTTFMKRLVVLDNGVPGFQQAANEGLWSSWWFQPIRKILVKLEIFPK